MASRRLESASSTASSAISSEPAFDADDEPTPFPCSSGKDSTGFSTRLLQSSYLKFQKSNVHLPKLYLLVFKY